MFGARNIPVDAPGFLYGVLVPAHPTRTDALNTGASSENAILLGAQVTLTPKLAEPRLRWWSGRARRLKEEIMRARLHRADAAVCLAVATWLAITVVSTIAATADRDKATTTSIESSVVKIFVHSTPPDLLSPWQKAGTESSSGSGVVIDGRRILTAAHVVADAVSIQLKRAGQPDRFSAEVIHIAHDADLALLRPVDPSFFEGVSAVNIGETPEVNSKVQAYGFPVGGDAISVTSGVISRIEVSTYHFSMEDLLMAQIDAAINPGNSGGPVISEGSLVGIALQTLDKAENVGYMAPTPVIRHFLRDIDDGRYDGFPRLGFDVQDLESPANRASHGMNSKDTGVLVSRVDFGGPVQGLVSTGDVIAAIDGFPIANDGTVDLPSIGRVNFAAVFRAKQIGDTVSLKLQRGGERVQQEIELKPHRSLVPGRHGDRPEYFVFAGVVFQPLTVEYLRQFEDPPADLANYALYQNSVSEHQRQVILVQKVLPHAVNQGYEEWEDYVVTSVNGAPPRDMTHLAELVDSATGPWLKILTEDHSLLTLNLREARAAHPKILASFGISKDRHLVSEEARAQDPGTAKRR